MTKAQYNTSLKVISGLHESLFKYMQPVEKMNMFEMSNNSLNGCIRRYNKFIHPVLSGVAQDIGNARQHLAFLENISNLDYGFSLQNYSGMLRKRDDLQRTLYLAEEAFKHKSAKLNLKNLDTVRSEVKRMQYFSDEGELLREVQKNLIPCKPRKCFGDPHGMSVSLTTDQYIAYCLFE